MEVVAAALFEVISVFGPPTLIISDNGAEFINSVVDHVSRLHGVDRRVITLYRPQANGQVERANGALIRFHSAQGHL